MIEVKNIRKGFGEKQVLKGVSVKMESGKCNLIIGASGSGKCRAACAGRFWRAPSRYPTHGREDMARDATDAGEITLAVAMAIDMVMGCPHGLQPIST